jgi:hypothetical protein
MMLTPSSKPSECHECSLPLILIASNSTGGPELNLLFLASNVLQVQTALFESKKATTELYRYQWSIAVGDES